jgi:hypothetical protein
MNPIPSRMGVEDTGESNFGVIREKVDEYCW